MVVLSPLLVGLMRQVRARLEGRVGAGVLQPWRDLRKLFAKEPLQAEGTSWVMSAGPVVLIASSALVCALVPLVGTVTFTLVPDDLFVVVSVLLLGTVALALVGLDAGIRVRRHGFEPAHDDRRARRADRPGVGLRAVDPGRLVRPVADRRRTPRRPGQHRVAGQPARAASRCRSPCVAETGRLPVDNPSTHLELTMVHEAMVLESSGRDLALARARVVAAPGGPARPGRQPARARGASPATVRPGACCLGVVALVAQARGPRRRARRRRGLPRQAAAVPRPRAARRLVRAGLPRRDRLLPRGEAVDHVGDASTPSCIGLCAGVLLLTAVLIVWRRSLAAVRAARRPGRRPGGARRRARGARGRASSCSGVAGLVLLLKAFVLPCVLAAGRVQTGAVREETPLINTTTSLIALSLLTMLAYLVSRAAARPRRQAPATAAVPVGIALVLYRVPGPGHPTARLLPARRLPRPRQRHRDGRLPHRRRRAARRRARRLARRAARRPDPAGPDRSDPPSSATPTSTS